MNELVDEVGTWLRATVQNCVDSYGVHVLRNSTTVHDEIGLARGLVPNSYDTVALTARKLQLCHFETRSLALLWYTKALLESEDFLLVPVFCLLLVDLLLLFAETGEVSFH